MHLYDNQHSPQRGRLQRPTLHTHTDSISYATAVEQPAASSEDQIWGQTDGQTKGDSKCLV